MVAPGSPCRWKSTGDQVEMEERDRGTAEGWEVSRGGRRGLKQESPSLLLKGKIITHLAVQTLAGFFMILEWSSSPHHSASEFPTLPHRQAAITAREKEGPTEKGREVQGEPDWFMAVSVSVARGLHRQAVDCDWLRRSSLVLLSVDPSS